MEIGLYRSACLLIQERQAMEAASAMSSNVLFKLFLIAGVLWFGINLWIAHRKGVMLETRVWSPRWPVLHRNDDRWWFYLCLSGAWLGLIVCLIVLIRVLLSDWGIKLPELFF
jgi:hypothetical protein